MSSSWLPTEHCNKVIQEIARDEGFETFEIESSQGSKDGDNYLSDIIRVVISGPKKDGQTHSLSLIFKVSLKNPLLRENSFIQQFFLREAFVYTKILPTLDELQKDLPEGEKFLFPKLYKAVIDEGDELVVMEDMSSKGYVMLDRMKSFNYDELVACIKNVARFHATSIVLRAKDPKVYEEMCSHSLTLEHINDALTQLLSKNIPSARKLIANEVYEGVIGSILDKLMDHVRSAFDDNKTDPYTVLCHGDCWTNNLFFNYKDGLIDKMIFLDWQMISKGPPIFDLAYILLIGLDSEMRIKHYKEMLDFYYECISWNVTNMGVDISKHYPLAVYREHIKKHMKMGLVMSFGILPVTLGKKGDNDIISMIKKKDSDESWKRTYSETCHTRLKELFGDCVKLNII